MIRKAKKSKAKKAKSAAKRGKPKPAPAKRAKHPKPQEKLTVSPLEEIPFVLGYAFYTRPSGR